MNWNRWFLYSSNSCTTLIRTLTEHLCAAKCLRTTFMPNIQRFGDRSTCIRITSLNKASITCDNWITRVMVTAVDHVMALICTKTYVHYQKNQDKRFPLRPFKHHRWFWENLMLGTVLKSWGVITPPPSLSADHLQWSPSNASPLHSCHPVYHQVSSQMVLLINVLIWVMFTRAPVAFVRVFAFSQSGDHP